jgi:putative Mg2+ transporter-C (MgtC) family protein
MPFDEFLMRLAIALGLGLVLGLDREIKHAPVGVRTFALVSLGAAVYTMLTLRLGAISAERADLAVDPSRLIQGLIGGIGFLGAGAIIGSTSGNRVRGIATGAAIWVSGGVGVSCGLGLYWEALAITFVTAGLLFVTEVAQAKWGMRDEILRQPERHDGNG